MILYNCLICSFLKKIHLNLFGDFLLGKVPACIKKKSEKLIIQQQSSIKKSNTGNTFISLVYYYF